MVIYTYSIYIFDMNMTAGSHSLLHIEKWGFESFTNTSCEGLQKDEELSTRWLKYTALFYCIWPKQALSYPYISTTTNPIDVIQSAVYLSHLVLCRVSHEVFVKLWETWCTWNEERATCKMNWCMNTKTNTHTHNLNTHFLTIRAQGFEFEVSRYFIKYSDALS